MRPGFPLDKVEGRQFRGLCMSFYTADLIYARGATGEPEVMPDHYIQVDDNGRIVKLGPLSELDSQDLQETTVFKDCMIVPGLVNTHNHSFQSLLKGFQDDRSFFEWRDKALYKYSELLTEEDIYNGALFAFSEMLLQGVTTVCDFFYINDQDNKNARAIIRAAKDLGMRITLARTMYDWDGAPERFRETVDQAVNNTRALMDEFTADSMVDVIPAPHSLHAASIEMIRAGRDLAEEKTTVFHMHVAEGQYERQMMEEKQGLPPVKYLDREGILNDRLVMIHCVWLDDEEIGLMAQRGAALSYNPSSNMFLGDGITRIKEMVDAGISISLGTDGGCSNNRASIIEEMRMTSLLQKVKFCDSTVITAEQVFMMGTVNGGVNLNRPVGNLGTGYEADFVVIDLNDLSMQPRQNADKNLVYAMQPMAIREVYVAGKKIMENGKILTIPQPKIVEKVQATTGGWT